MEYSKIIAVSGLPGLFELVSSKTDGAVVRSLEDKSTKFVSSRIHQFSHLESIEIYTVRDNVNLADILKAMKASGEKLPDEKDANSLKKYFEKVYGDIDFERVYSSDLKKMVKWFSILDKNQVEIKITEPVEEPEPELIPAEPVKEKKAKEKPAEKAPLAEKPKEKPKEKAKEKPAPKEKSSEKVKPKEKPKAKPAGTAKDKAKKPAEKKKSK
ncbi:MAG: DUF5606 domain-containing protein [Chitinophagales bacterium]